MKKCEMCQSRIDNDYETFGPVGRTLCFKCEQKRQNPKVLSIAAYTVFCGTCGHSIDRYPVILGDDYYFECEYCHSDSNIHIKNGRAIGPKSKRWDDALRSIKDIGLESVASIMLGDEIKTEPPLEFCYDSPRKWSGVVAIIIKPE